MISLKAIISSLIVIYLLSVIAFKLQEAFSTRKLETKKETTITFSDSLLTESPYKFNNNALANQVLSQLDIVKPIDDSVFKNQFRTKNRFAEPVLGMKSEDDYCERHREYIIKHPLSIFNMNFFLEWNHRSIMRDKVAKVIGRDVQPWVSFSTPKHKKEQFIYSFEPSVNLYVTTVSLYKFKHVGKHYSCLSQTSNHIPGNAVLARKDYIAEAGIKYVEEFKDRPQCMSYDKIFPKTWLLYNEEDCKDFFAELNSPNYQKLKKERRIVYIRKLGVGVHRGEGVFPFNEEEEKLLKETYKNGEICGEVKTNNIMQYYIHNPLLLNGRKFDFRMYMLVASTNPLIAYYHDGFLRVSLVSYDKNSDDKKVLLTNLVLSKQIYEDVKNNGTLFEGMDEEELRLAQQWSFERLQAYLLEEGVIQDPNWLDNYLRPEFKKAMIHLIRSVSQNYFVTSSVYELYGVDFMLDEDMNLWFIEANDGPAFDGYSIPMEKFIIKMLQDHFEIIHGLLKSRMKRVINYVNKITDNGEAVMTSEGKVRIKDLKRKIVEFEEISKNYFDEEFLPKPTNGFSKIIDGNYKGVEMYQGYITKECL